MKRYINKKPKILYIFLFYIKIYFRLFDNGEIEFFTEKDYGEDTTNMDNSAEVVNAINRIREPVRMMSHENQMKTMKYIQNFLTAEMQNLNW